MKKVGKIDDKVITLLELPQPSNKTIFIGQTNINHMMSKHPKDFAKYGNEISHIISSPDYIGINKKDNSIEYIKEFKIDNEFVKVAVRVSNGNKFFVRSLYVVSNNRVYNFLKKKTLLKYWKKYE